MSCLIFSSLFLLLVLVASSQPCNKADMLTLLKLKNSFGNPTQLNSWNSDNAPNCCSTWRGVGCTTARRISSLGIFSTNSSAGSLLPSFISDLSALTTLTLFNLPNLVGPLPSSLTNLTSLTQLTISTSAISGTIPRFLCDISKLSYLDLSANRFTGKIPACLLSRARNTLPSLKLYQNKLTGKIPRHFASSDFATVDVSRNQLHGDPSFLFAAPNSSLGTINLAWNQFKFDLSPVKFPPLLEQLDLSHNKIRGNIPRQITRLKKLAFVDFSYNQLCGPIPKLSTFNPVPAVFEQNKCLCGVPLWPCQRHV